MDCLEDLCGSGKALFPEMLLDQKAQNARRVRTVSKVWDVVDHLRERVQLSIGPIQITHLGESSDLDLDQLFLDSDAKRASETVVELTHDAVQYIICTITTDEPRIFESRRGS